MIEIFTTKTIEIIINASITGLGTAIGSTIGTYLITRYFLDHPAFLKKVLKSRRRKA